MPKITVDGKTIECKDRQMILQACLDAGIRCRITAITRGFRSPLPAASAWSKSRASQARAGLPDARARRHGRAFQSPKAIANQKQVMEYLLINHPLDCPVCDQAGECLLQDYSYQYGRSQSRFEEDKAKKPKKDVGEHVLLYNDRCIMCTRCVRFTREVAGTSELYVDGRGHQEEIDIFPGKPLNNKLSGNVVDICPVGALLDKDFLFKQRVWLLKQTPVDFARSTPAARTSGSITTRASSTASSRATTRRSTSGGSATTRATATSRCTMTSDCNRRTPHAVRHAGRHRATRRRSKQRRHGLEAHRTPRTSDGSLYAMLSPMMACEEA